MSIAFWSAEVKVGQSIQVQPPEGYVLNLVNAALTNAGGSHQGAYVVFCETASIEGEPIKCCMATLRHEKCEQYNLGLVYGFDVPVTFSVEGDTKAKGRVHLSGYYQPGPEDEMDSEDEGMYEDDDEKYKSAYHSMLGEHDEEEEEEEDDDDDDDDDDESDEVYATSARVTELKDDENEDEDEADTSSDSEDEAMDAEFIEKMIKKRARDEPKSVKPPVPSPAAGGSAKKIKGAEKSSEKRKKKKQKK